MADLFDQLERAELKPEPLITWDESLWTGRTADGRLIRYAISDFSHLFVATIPLRCGAITRRARKTVAEMQDATVDALKEEENAE